MSDLDNPGVKAVITLGVLIGVAIIAFVTAKLVRVCMDDKYGDENDSAMSETTRDLIRARLSVIQFQKKTRLKQQKKDKKANTLSAFKKWKQFVKFKKKVGVLKDPDTCVVNIEKLKGVNGKIPNGNGVNGKLPNGTNENKVNAITKQDTDHSQEDYSETTPKLKRLTSLNAPAPPTSPRPSQNSQKLNPPPASESAAPVPRGRPVSSKQRTMPNVTQTDLKRDPTMISLKAVQCEENSIKLDKTIDNESAKT